MTVLCCSPRCWPRTRRTPSNGIVPAGRAGKGVGRRAFTEGPAYGPGGCVYFSDIGITPDPKLGNRIMKFDPATGKTTEYRNPSGRANGLDFDPDGRLVAAEGANTGGTRRVTRTEKDGKVVVLADRWMGKTLNSPNDVTIDVKGRVYFSDPRYVGDEPARSPPNASTASTPTAQSRSSSPTWKSRTASSSRRI